MNTIVMYLWGCTPGGFSRNFRGHNFSLGVCVPIHYSVVWNDNLGEALHVKENI